MEREAFEHKHLLDYWSTLPSERNTRNTRFITPEAAVGTQHCRYRIRTGMKFGAGARALSSAGKGLSKLHANLILCRDEGRLDAVIERVLFLVDLILYDGPETT